MDLVHGYYYYRERNYSEYLQLFTDRSNDPLIEVAGAAVVVPVLQTEISKRTSNYFYIYFLYLCCGVMCTSFSSGEDVKC